jgi:hypothetical protein
MSFTVLSTKGQEIFLIHTVEETKTQRSLFFTPGHTASK